MVTNFYNNHYYFTIFIPMFNASMIVLKEKINYEAAARSMMIGND